MPMVRSQLPELTMAGINVKFDDANKNVEDIAGQLFGVPSDIDKKSPVYKLASVTGLGLMRPKPETSPTRRDEIQRGRQHELVAGSYALGCEFSRELVEDNRVDLMDKAGALLGKSSAESYQFSAALILGRAFGAITAATAYPTNTATAKVSTTTQTWLGADGCSLVYASHPIAGSPTRTTANYAFPTTYSNANNVALTEAGLAALILRMDLMPNERGVPSKRKAKTVLVPAALRLTARQVLTSLGTLASTQANPYSAAVKNLIGGEGLVDLYWDKLIDPGAYFLLAEDVKEDLIVFPKSLDAPLEHDYDVNKKVHIVDVFRRWAFGWDNPRCICGSTIT